MISINPEKVDGEAEKKRKSIQELLEESDWADFQIKRKLNKIK